MHTHKHTHTHLQKKNRNDRVIWPCWIIFKHTTKQSNTFALEHFGDVCVCASPDNDIGYCVWCVCNIHTIGDDDDDDANLIIFFVSIIDNRREQKK